MFLAVASCKPKENMVYLANDKAKQDEEIARAQYVGLLIHEGDILEINVNAFDELAVRPFNLSTMSRTGQTDTGARTNFQGSEYTVNADGEIHFPVLGTLFVKGMTKQQLVVHIANRLNEYLKDPFVTVVHRNFSISVIGEVKSPGQVSSKTEKLNVFQALALAGDMTAAGDRTQLKLIRSNEGRDEIVMLDVTDQNIVNSPYYYLQQNDILYVQPDRNRQIAANVDPNRGLYFQIFGVTMTIVSLIITLSR